MEFDSYLVSKAGVNRHVLEIETESGWVAVHDVTTSGQSNLAATSGFSVGQRFAQRVRLRGVSGTAQTLREFRIGKGGAHPVPAFSQTADTSIATLGETSGSVQVGVSPNSVDSPYFEGPVPLTFSIVSGELPNGATMSSSGLIGLPSAASTGPGGWAFTVRIADPFGRTQERQYFIFAEGESAALKMPVSVTRGGVAVPNWGVLYLSDTDGVTFGTDDNGAIVYEYAESVTFDSVHRSYSGSGTSVAIDVEIGGTWHTVSSISTSSYVYPSSFNITAKRVRVRTISGNHALQSFKPGNGPWHVKPTLGSFPGLGDIGESAKSAQASFTTSYAYTDQAPTFRVSEGALPPGAALSEHGELSLPAAADTDFGMWRPVITMTAAFGLEASLSLQFTNPWASAAETYPVSVTSGQGQDLLGVLYDDDVATTFSINNAAANTVTFVYEKPVSVSRYYVRKATSTSFPLYVDALIDGQWVSISTSPVGASTALTSVNVNLAVSDQFRVRGSSATSYSINTFRFGSATVSGPPPLP